MFVTLSIEPSLNPTYLEQKRVTIGSESVNMFTVSAVGVIAVSQVSLRRNLSV